MPRALQAEFGFGGLNTRAASTGLPVLEQIALQDMRVVGRDLVQRKGISRVQQLAGDGAALDFDGVNEHLSNTVDTRVWTLGLYWTIEFAIEPDTAAGTMGLVCVGHTTPSVIFDITGGNIRARVWDSAGTLSTVTVGAAAASVQTVQLTRSAGTLTSRLNNAAGGTGTMVSTLLTRAPAGDLRVARDDGTNYYDGTMCYLRAFSLTRSDHNDRLIRHPAPRASYVLADYDLAIETGPLCYDRSRYENHLIAQNTPTEVATLCHNAAAIRGVSQSVDAATNRRQLLVMANGLYYIADLD